MAGAAVKGRLGLSRRKKIGGLQGWLVVVGNLPGWEQGELPQWVKAHACPAAAAAAAAGATVGTGQAELGAVACGPAPVAHEPGAVASEQHVAHEAGMMAGQ